MTLSFKLSLFLFVLFILGDKSLSLTDYQIRKFCKNEKRESTCIRILQEKKSDLQKGNFIEIPVIPYKR
tara:strand:- start:222 stop:428 length:207 start_codon:yes stop_codon:yes gene_type:complete